MTSSLDPYEAPLPEFGDDTTTYQGHCRSVEPEYETDELAQPAGVGDIVLHLDYAEGFYPGATIQVADGSGPDGQGFLVVIAPDDDAVDYDDDILTLTTGLPVAVDVGTEVHVWSVQRGERVTTYSASVIPDDDEYGDPVEVTVPHTTVPYLRAGIEAGDGVSVTYRREPGKGETDFELVDILGAQPSADAGTLDPETYPDDLRGDTGPTEPPAASPAVTVFGLPDGLALQLLDPIEAGARVQYHLSADQAAGVNFAPTAATTVGAETVAGAVLVETLPDGTPFVDGVTYYARAVALNDLGAAAPGLGGAGALNRNAIREQFIAMLRSVLILTGRIEVGQAYIDADKGFGIPNPDGSFSVFPFNGDPIKLLAEVIATTLTVSGIATFLALVRIRRRLEVGDGISAPTEAPSVADHWPAPALPTLGGDVAGLVQHPTDASAWVIAVNDTATPGKTVYKVPKAGTSPEVLFTIAGTSTITGITFVADHYFVLLRNLVNGRNSIRKFTTAGVQAAVNENVGTFPHRATIGTDGTLVLLSWVAAFGTNNNALFVRTYTAATLADQDVFSIESTTSFLDLAWVGRGAFNFGATRTVIAAADNDAWVWSGTLAAPTRQAAQTFKRALGVPLAGLTWDGTRFQALTSTGRVAAHSAARIADQAITLAGSWEGRTSAGASIETNTGTTRAVTVGAQAQLLVTVPTPPEADLADPGKANRAAVYADVAGVRRRQAGVALGSRTVVLDSLSAAGRVAGATGTFDSSPGDVVPERGTDDNKVWRLFGSGAGWVSDLAWSATGVWTLGARFVAAVAAALVLVINTAGSTLRAAVQAASKADTASGVIRGIAVNDTGNTTRTVTFPTGRFDAIPSVQITVESGVAPNNIFASTNVVSATGFNILARRGSGSGTVDIHWRAEKVVP